VAAEEMTITVLEEGETETEEGGREEGEVMEIEVEVEEEVMEIEVEEEVMEIEVDVEVTVT
jgi:hypothetical protein